MLKSLSWPVCRARVLILGLLLGAALVLTACASAPAGALAPDQFMPLADFPEGFGRGFPVVQIPAGTEIGQTLRKGDIAPDFALVLPDGRYTSLRSFYGQPTVLNFWATWCPPCRREMPELMRAAAADPYLVMLPISVQETQDQVEPFATEYAMHTPVALDLDGALQDVYSVNGLPTTFFIDKEGRIAAIYSGALTAEALREQLATLR